MFVSCCWTGETEKSNTDYRNQLSEMDQTTPAHMLQSFTKFTLGCGKEQISFKRAKKTMSPALKDNKTRGVRWHQSRRQTYRFSTETYQHNSKHRQTRTTANKEKFLTLRWQRTPWLLDNKVWDALFSYPILLNLNSTLSHSPAAPPMPCCFQVQKETCIEENQEFSRKLEIFQSAYFPGSIVYHWLFDTVYYYWPEKNVYIMHHFSSLARA